MTQSHAPSEKTEAEVYRDTVYMATLAANHEGYGWPRAMADNPRYQPAIQDMIRIGHLVLEPHGFVLTPVGVAHFRRYILSRDLDSSQRSGAYNRVVKSYDESGQRVEVE